MTDSLLIKSLNSTQRNRVTTATDWSLLSREYSRVKTRRFRGQRLENQERELVLVLLLAQRTAPSR